MWTNLIAPKLHEASDVFFFFNEHFMGLETKT